MRNNYDRHTEEVQLKVSSITVSPALLAPDLLCNFSLKLGPRDILGILGSNGVGKTTLLHCLSGSLVPKAGDVRLGNLSVYDQSMACKKQIGFLPDTVPLIPYFTVQENLKWMARFRGLTNQQTKEAIETACHTFGLTSWLSILAKHLSLGQRKLVGIAGAVIHHPKLIVLDEPLNDLDTQVREHVLTVLQTLSRDAIVIFTSHYYRDLATISNKILLLEKGQCNWILDKSQASSEEATQPKSKNKTSARSKKKKSLTETLS